MGEHLSPLSSLASFDFKMFCARWGDSWLVNILQKNSNSMTPFGCLIHHADDIPEKTSAGNLTNLK
jgi:hypothetical protein